MKRQIKKFFDEFASFALKGNVMNLAVGVIIGAGFQGVVTSLTDNILSPIIGLFAGANFDALQFEFFGVVLKYGAFITTVINFFIMAFVVFLLIKGMNKITEHHSPEPAGSDPPARKCRFCITEIDISATRCPACTSNLEE